MLRAERAKLKATDPDGLADAWTMIEVLTNPRRCGIDPDADPSLDEVLELRLQRRDEICDAIAGANAADLERNCVPPDTPGHPRKDHTMLHCLHVILKEEWQHHRYAVRDLEAIGKRTPGLPGSC
jgi:hypothetical protein